MKTMRKTILVCDLDSDLCEGEPVEYVVGTVADPKLIDLCNYHAEDLQTYIRHANGVWTVGKRRSTVTTTPIKTDTFPITPIKPA